MDQILARMTPTKQSFPLSSFLTPPDENQPLDFSKRARGRGRVSPLTPGTPVTPVLSVPNIQPRKLQPDLCLPHSPLPLTVLGQSLRTNLTQQSPAPPPQMSPMSPFLFGAAGLCFPSLLQSMISQTPPAPAQSRPVAPPAPAAPQPPQRFGASRPAPVRLPTQPAAPVSEIFSVKYFW